MTETEIDALPTGRELDALVAERVMGWRVVARWPDGEAIWADDKDSTQAPDGFPAYSQDIAAAWVVVEKLPRALWPEVGRTDDGHWYCEIVGRGDSAIEVSPRPLAREIADTAPLAICRAALKTIGLVCCDPQCGNFGGWHLPGGVH